MCRSYVYNDSFKEMELQSVLCQKKEENSHENSESQQSNLNSCFKYFKIFLLPSL